MPALCIECVKSSLQGVEPCERLFCSQRGQEVNCVDTCGDFKSLRPVLDLFGNAVSIELTPAGEAFFGIKANSGQGPA